MRGMVGRRVVPCVVAVGLLAGTTGLAPAARADEKKKKPGLFDFQGWSTPAGHEREAARQLLPGRFDLTPTAGLPGEPRTLRVRVYADRDYRELVLRWQTHLREQIKRINDVVEPVFAVRFEIESVRTWDRSHMGAPLDPILVELEALDPAREVDLVIGLVTPMHGVTTSMHQVGTARLLARHFVLRGMDNEQELLALDREFPLIGATERQDLYSVRKSHKEVALFLHEWGHTLGLLHHEDHAYVMNPTYDPRQSGFSPYERRVVSVAVEQRLAQPDQLFPESAALEPILADAPADEGSDRDRAQLLALVRARRHGHGDGPREAGATAASGAVEAGGLIAPEIAPYNRAVAAANAGRAEEAWTDLSPIVDRLVAARTATGKPPDPTTYRRAAALALSVGALSAADSLLARTDSKDPETIKLAADIDSRRHRLLLPPAADEVGVPRAREVAYTAGYREILRALEASDLATAGARLQSFARDFPDSPATDVVACQMDMSARAARKRAQAAKRCEAALAKYAGATRALLLLATMAANDRHDTLAEKHLRRAILLDPSDPGGWQMLAQLYRATRASQQLGALEQQHQALFSTPLPR